MPIIRGKHTSQLQLSLSPYLEDGLVKTGEDGDGGSVQGESPLEVGGVLLQGHTASVELRRVVGVEVMGVLSVISCSYSPALETVGGVAGGDPG